MMDNSQPKPPKFIVCIDKREESLVALKLVCAKAKQRGGTVDLLHILPPTDFEAIAGVAERIREEQREAAEVLMQEMADAAYQMSGIMPTMVLREGVVEDEIINYVSNDADATVLTLGVTESTSRGQLIAWIASQLGVKLLIPLLLVPGNLTEEQFQAVL